ncbi:MAG: glycosyltransferase family 4 protein [Candidatus Vogelbacteria bacterium]|nr:glycosyltransferase family 4 protein [Candidatus Vogelbacteria bacterium]
MTAFGCNSLGWSMNLMIIGEGEELEKLKWLARAKRLEDRIHFLGRVEDARAYLKAFDIFTLTSRTEAFPYVFLEAGAAGVPIIASEVGGIPEVITDPELGILVPPGNVEEIKKSLLFMLKKPKYCDLAGKNLRQRVTANFSLKKMVEKTVELYRN